MPDFTVPEDDICTLTFMTGDIGPAEIFFDDIVLTEY
jgi:hypothetical protein